MRQWRYRLAERVANLSYDFCSFYWSLKIHNFLHSILLKLFLTGLSDFSASIESKLFLEWTCPLSRPYFHEVTVVRKIITQSECNFFSLQSLRENSDEVSRAVWSPCYCIPQNCLKLCWLHLFCPFIVRLFYRYKILFILYFFSITLLPPPPLPPLPSWILKYHLNIYMSCTHRKKIQLPVTILSFFHNF